ncbi:MAG: hypothetical protein R2864_02175 [Syntrophotaleaceae bacterium]
MNVKNFRCLLFSFLLIGLTVVPAFADTGDIALGIKASTLGAGAEATVGLCPSINLRAGANAFSFDFDANTSDIDYDVEADLLSFPVILDLHPFKESGFRISAGVLINKNKADAEGSSQSSYTIGDTVYTPEELGSLTGKIDFNSLAPYVGIGWGNAVGKDKRWSFSCDFGVVFQGDPKIDLVANGTLASDPNFQDDLAREKKELEDELDDYKYYPLISLGITYKF